MDKNFNLRQEVFALYIGKHVVPFLLTRLVLRPVNIYIAIVLDGEPNYLELNVVYPWIEQVEPILVGTL